MLCFFFFKQKTAYEMRISDWSSDVCSSDQLPKNRPPRKPVKRICCSNLISCPPPRNAPQRLGNRTRGDVSACSALSIGSPPYPFGFPRKPICYLAVGAVVAVGTWCLNISNQTKSVRSEEHTSEIQSLMRISYAVFCLKKKKMITKSNISY